MDNKHIATVRVSLAVDVLVSDRWGGDSTIEQVYKQAANQAIGRIRNLAREAGITLVPGEEPKVTAVLVNRD